jgi:hypothetical protein
MAQKRHSPGVERTPRRIRWRARDAAIRCRSAVVAVLDQKVGVGFVEQLLVQRDVSFATASIYFYAVQVRVDQELDVALEVPAENALFSQLFLHLS